MLSDPEESFTALVNLVHKSQIPMSPVPLNFINANSFDVSQIDMVSSPFDCHLNATENVFQLVRNALLTSVQLILFAQSAKNHLYLLVNWLFPLAHGTVSTVIPQHGHSTRLML